MLPEGSIIVASIQLKEIGSVDKIARLPYDAHVHGAINLGGWEPGRSENPGLFEKIAIDPDGDFWAYFETLKLGPFGLRQIKEYVAHIKIREGQK